MSFWTRQSFIFIITLAITSYIFNFTSIPNEVILNHLEYNKNANYRDLEFYLHLCSLYLCSFICFYYITALVFSPHRIDNKKILEWQEKMTDSEFRNF